LLTFRGLSREKSRKRDSEVSCFSKLITGTLTEIMEALQAKLDSLQRKVNQLQVENLRLKEANPEGAKQIDSKAELEELHQTLETTKATHSETLDELHEKR